MCLLIVIMLGLSLLIQNADAAEPVHEPEVSCEVVRGIEICEVPPVESLEYIVPGPDNRTLNERTIPL